MNDNEMAKACADAFAPLAKMEPKVPPWRKTVVLNKELRADLEDASDYEVSKLLQALRDHRSLDGIRFYVHKTRETICVHCKMEPSEDSNGFPWCCAKAQTEAEAMGLTRAD